MKIKNKAILLAALMLFVPLVAISPAHKFIPDEAVIIQGNTLKPNTSPVIEFGDDLPRVWRTITAYNAVPEQTDQDYCISASGLNVCETEKRICATNEFPIGTQIMIDGIVWEVQDRTNARYGYRIDLLMENYEDAINWGIQTKEILVLNN